MSSIVGVIRFFSLYRIYDLIYYSGFNFCHYVWITLYSFRLSNLYPNVVLRFSVIYSNQKLFQIFDWLIFSSQTNILVANSTRVIKLFRRFAFI